MTRFSAFVPVLIGLCCSRAVGQTAVPAPVPACPEMNTRPVLGGQLFAAGGEVTVALHPLSETGMVDDLYLFPPGGAPVPLVSGEVKSKVIRLGEFPAGSEIVLGIVLRFSKRSFVMGPANRNSDRTAHAFTQTTGYRQAAVFFEDNPGGGDKDYNDRIVIVDGVMPPLSLTFLDRTTAPVLPPSVFPRTYPDEKKILHDYPTVDQKEWLRLAVKVCGLPEGSPPLPMRVHVAAQESSGGHEPGDHTISRAHGWLIATPRNPNGVREARPEGELESGQQRPEASETGRVDATPEEGVEMALAQTDPGGESYAHILEAFTDDDGILRFAYLPPEVAGVETLMVEVADNPKVAPVSLKVEIRVEGLMDLSSVRQETWRAVKRSKNHPDSLWATPATKEKLTQASLLYAQKQSEDAELQGWINELSRRNYDFPDKINANLIVTKKAEPLFVTHASLPWGGLLDLSGDYGSPGWGHRDGADLDLMTRHLVKGDPRRATLKEAFGDARLTEARDTERNNLVKRIQFRRLELLKKALLEAGGRFIPDEAHFSEGDHLHVSFGPPQSPSETTPPAKTAKPEEPSDLPLTPGLKPANPSAPLPK